MKFIEVDTLILGATFYGCGLARSIPGSVVVESTVAPGSGAVFSFDPGTGWTAEAAHPEAEAFRQELLRRRALTREGHLLTGALAPVLAHWCLNRDIIPRLGTAPIEIGVNHAVFIDYCGTRIAYHARRILDAREPNHGEKFITASIYSPSPLTEGRYGAFQLSFSGIDGLYYAGFPLDEAVSWPEARSLFVQCWKERPEPLRQAKLQLIGSRFCRRRFANAAAALDAGLADRGEPVRYQEEPRPEADSCDVAVIGFGTAGCIAAIAAARRGMRVMAIERNTYPGGTWTGGFVPTCYIQQPSGIAREFYLAAARMDGCLGITEPLKFVQERAALACDVDIHYDATVLEVIKEQNQVRGVVWRDQVGVVHTTAAAVVIDATAEATVCRLAGCELSRGRPSDREFNRYTNSMGTFHRNDFGVANFDAGRIAQYDADNFSTGYLTGFTRHLADDYRTNRICIQPADLPGLREGDRIIPEKVYTLDEFFASRGKDPEPLFHVISNLDTHSNDLALEQEIFQDWLVAASLWEVRLSIPIPRRVLFPRQITGLIVAGRHLGVDHELGCAIRMIPAMAAVGEAAGMIAARAIGSATSPEALSYSAFADELRDQLGSPSAVNLAWYAMSPEEIKQQLAGKSPGLAIWNARCQELREQLAMWFKRALSRSDFQYHCAMALALLNEPVAIPVLMELAERRDSSMLNPGLAHTHTRGCVAVYLLGRLRAKEAVPLLLHLLQGEGQDEYRTHLFSALMKIGETWQETRPDIASSLRRIAEDRDWQLIEKLNGNGGGNHRVDGLFRLHIARTLDRWRIPQRITEIAVALPLDHHEKWLWEQYATLKNN